jgi:hypothetical protein
MKGLTIRKASVEVCGFLLAVLMIATTKALVYAYLAHAGVQYLTGRRRK